MGALTIDVKNNMMNAFLRRIPMADLAETFLGLHTDAPGVDGLDAEVTGLNYVRQAIDSSLWDAAVGGIVTLNSDVVYPTAGDAWGDLAWVSLWDADTGGVFLGSGQLASVRTIALGDTFRVKAGNLNVGIS